ncbi:hypothetical protein NECAME_05585 [Necator americanus]|uniref:Uncharacterized protein n=1 Tax=Necator americanus TaxID=51031 RepID=W2SIB9_NECAM|nr:hypothetical protein NECAME_05585 [Necator americanus]ETN68502.1 hypothetical protein NECAME_05585 [Necator americanus]
MKSKVVRAYQAFQVHLACQVRHLCREYLVLLALPLDRVVLALLSLQVDLANKLHPVFQWGLERHRVQCALSAPLRLLVPQDQQHQCLQVVLACPGFLGSLEVLEVLAVQAIQAVHVDILCSLAPNWLRG